MTTTPTAEPKIPEEARPEWVGLLAAADELLRARREVDRLSIRCHVLVGALLRKGVRRRDLIGRPFSAALISRIQHREGLTRRDRKAS